MKNLMLVYISFLLSALYINTIALSLQNASPGGEPMLFISIFHQCPRRSGNISTTASQLCRACVQSANKNKHSYWNFILKNNKLKINQLMNADDFQLIEFTYCSNTEAIQIAINLKLNKTFFVKNDQTSKQKEPKWNRRGIKNWQKTSRVVYVIVYTSESLMSKFFSAIFLGERYIVTFFNKDFKPPSSPGLALGNILISSELFSTNAKQLLNHLDTRIYDIVTYHGRLTHIHYFGLIYIASDSNIYKIEFETLYNEYLMKEYKEVEKCFFVYKLNVSDEGDLKNLMGRIDRDKELRNLIVIGKPKDQTKIFNRYMAYTHLKYDSVQEKFWIFFDVDKNSDLNYSIFPPLWIFSFKAEGLQFTETEYFNNLLVSLRRHFGREKAYTSKETALINMCNQAYENQVLRMMWIIHLQEQFDNFKYYSFTRFKESCLRRLAARKRGLRNMFQLQYNGLRLVNHYVQDGQAIDVIYGDKCPVRRCGAGTEPFFGKDTQTDRPWNTFYGWSCRVCRDGYFQANSGGNGTCSSCPKMTLTTKDKDGCYDPYKTEYLNYHVKPIAVAAVVFLCILGCLLSLLTTIIFTLFRATPFVKASDFRSSLVHLLFMLFLFAALPFLFVGEPTTKKCLLQPIAVLIFCICPSTLILIKSQKILVAFKTKTRLTSCDIRKSLAKQFSIIGTIIIIDSVVLLFTILTKRPQVLATFDHGNYLKRLHCNTGHHVNVQILLLILQHLFTTIQAFRGRNLPGPFNEAMPIVYSAFISVVSYTIVFPIYYLQKDINTKIVVHVLIILIAHLCMICIFYGPKLLVILFVPGKNTAEYLRAEMMQSSVDRVGLQIRNQRQGATAGPGLK